MKVVIFSDLHDNLDNLKKLLTWSTENKIDKMICCGDLCRAETLKYLAQNFPGEIFLVSGNAELFVPRDTKNFSNLNYSEHFLEFKIGNQRILITHKPGDLKKYLSEQMPSIDFAFHGHTHKPWLSQEDGIIIANPGTLGATFEPATFALLDCENGKLELKIL
jgi:putative phosphoesterase